MRLGLGLLLWGVAGFVVMSISRAAAVGAVPAGTGRSAAGPIWDEVIAPLRWWLLAAAAAGLVLAAASYWTGRSRRAV